MPHEDIGLFCVSHMSHHLSERKLKGRKEEVSHLLKLSQVTFGTDRLYLKHATLLPSSISTSSYQGSTLLPEVYPMWLNIENAQSSEGPLSYLPSSVGGQQDCPFRHDVLILPCG